VTRRYRTLAEAYRDGLARLIEAGTDVPSVRDPTSKASNFGRDDRPSREMLCDCFEVDDPSEALLELPDGAGPRVQSAYAFGLLAWTLAGRSDASILAYYRPGATDYSDDQFTLSGAFGNRLFGLNRTADQLKAIIDKLSQDPSGRRAFAPILTDRDNFRESREYPCAVGVQLFVRDGRLFFLTVMRAQQALTVLPYDAFLFMLLQSYCASILQVSAGPYIHFSSTYHIYQDELSVARRISEDGCRGMPVMFGPDAVAEANLLIRMERQIREAATQGEQDVIRGWNTRQLSGLVAAARDAFVRHSLDH